MSEKNVTKPAEENMTETKETESMSEKNVNKAEETESIMIPRRGSNEDINLYVAINGRSWLIPRGKRVELPKFVCDHIRAAWAAEEKADAHSEELIQQGNQGMNA